MHSPFFGFRNWKETVKNTIKNFHSPKTFSLKHHTDKSNTNMNNTVSAPATLFLILNLLFSMFSIAQTEQGRGEAKNSKKVVPEQIENSGKLRYKLLFEQNRENSMTMNAIDVNELKFVHFAEKDLFYFEKNNDPYKPGSYDVLEISNDTAIIRRGAMPDTTLTNVKPVMTWLYDSVRTMVVDSIHIFIQFMDTGCMDTQFYSTFFEDKDGGRLSFHYFTNNIVFYNPDKKKFYVVFFKFCRNEIKIYEVYDPDETHGK